MKTAYRNTKQIKQALLSGMEVKINRWAALINKKDEVEIWDPKGKGVVASLIHLDRAVSDFYRLAQGIPETMPKPVTYEKTPSGSGPLGDDTSQDKPWTDPKVNKQPVMQGPTGDPDLMDDTSQDVPWTDPAIDYRPQPNVETGGLPDTDLGKDTQKNKVDWEDKLKGPGSQQGQFETGKNMKARKKRAEEGKYIGNIGDVNWLEHGGTLIFETEYGLEATHIDPWMLDAGEVEDEYDPNMKWEVSSTPLDKLQIKDGKLVNEYGHEEWFSNEKTIARVAGFVGQEPEELMQAFTSDDPIELAWAYESVASYHGWINFDSDPQMLTREELKNRFEKITGEEIDLPESEEEDDEDFDVEASRRARRRRSQDMAPGSEGEEEMGTSDPDDEYYPEIEFEPHQIENQGENPSNLPNDLGGRNNARKQGGRRDVGSAEDLKRDLQGLYLHKEGVGGNSTDFGGTVEMDRGTVYVAIVHDGSGYNPMGCLYFVQDAHVDTALQAAYEALETIDRERMTPEDWKEREKDAEEYGMDVYELITETYDGMFYEMTPEEFKQVVESDTPNADELKVIEFEYPEAEEDDEDFDIEASRKRSQSGSVSDFIWDKLSDFNEWWETDAGAHYWRDFESNVNAWINTIEEAVKWAEESGTGDVSQVDAPAYIGELSTILFKLGPPGVSRRDFQVQLEDIQEEAINFAFETMTTASRKSFVDTFAKEARPGPSYQTLVNASPHANLLKDIADPERWAATQAVKGLTPKKQAQDDEFEDEPTEDDAFLTPSGSLGSMTSVSVSGEFLGEFKDDEEAEAALKEWMEANQFWPNVWYVDDHGGVQPYHMEASRKGFASGMGRGLYKDPEGKRDKANKGMDNMQGNPPDEVEAGCDYPEKKDKKSRRVKAGPRLKENWTTDGGYSRDIEAESPEELYHLTRSFGSEDDYDWSSIKPQGQVVEDEAGMPLEAKRAVDDYAKSYWKDYFNDYGEDLVKDDSTKKNRKETEPKVDETPKPAGQQKVKARRRTRGQAAPAQPADSAPPGGMPAAPDTAPQTPQQAPAAQPPMGQTPQKAPGAGDQGLKTLGWTDQDIKAMSDEDKQKILQVQLKKPGAGAPQSGAPTGQPGMKPPAKPAPAAPQEGPAPMPADLEQGMPQPTAKRLKRESKERKKIVRAFRMLAQMPVEQPAPAAPQTSPGQPVQTGPKPAAPVEPSPEFAQGGLANDMSPESQAMSIYNEILQESVQASSPEQVPALKSKQLVDRLLTEVGMTMGEARQLFGLKSGDGFNKLFQ